MDYIPLLKLFYTNRENYNEIYMQRYNNENAVHLNFKIHDNQAFFIKLPEFIPKIIEIYKIDKEISKLRWQLPPIAINHFFTKCLIDEIILTNDIEGVNSTRKEISSILSDLELQSKVKHKGERFYGLVQKYVLLKDDNEIMKFESCEDIRHLYNELVYNEIEEDDSDNLPDGKLFRKDSASVVTPTQKTIHTGVYPENNIINSMENALSILNDNSIELIFRVAVFHYLFGYIHPFYDGNGRTSRFISSYLLSKEFESIMAYRLSYSIKENISDYYNAFKICNDTRNKGDLTPFIIMFIDIIYSSLLKLKESLEEKHSQLSYYFERIINLPDGTDNKYFSLYSLLLQASLFSNEGISTGELMKILKISRTTLLKRIENLKKYNLIIIKAISNTNNYWLNLDVVDKFNSIADEN